MTKVRGLDPGKTLFFFFFRLFSVATSARVRAVIGKKIDETSVRCRRGNTEPSARQNKKNRKYRGDTG